jgi:heat shock protein HslJ
MVLVILAAGCRSADPTPAGSLTGTSWLAEEIDGVGVLEKVESTLTFDGSRIAGQAACNRYFGTAELGEGTLRLKPAGTTRMACTPPIMEQESRFLAALSAATAFRRERGKLLLLDEGGRVRARLVPRAPKPVGLAPSELAAFDCDGGLGFVMAPSASDTGTSDAIDLVLPDGRQRLARVPAASGARYTAGKISVWNKGREAILDLDGHVYKCREATLR